MKQRAETEVRKAYGVFQLQLESNSRLQISLIQFDHLHFLLSRWLSREEVGEGGKTNP